MILSAGEITSIYYHDIFDYPLTPFDLIRWRAGKKVKPRDLNFEIQQERGYLFVKGREGLIFKRIISEKNFQRKFGIARKSAEILAILPSVRAIGLTGSLAMKNAKDSSDIDLIIIAQRGSLWTTRILARLILKLFGIPFRKFGDKEEKDKICLNMWLDESVILWPERGRNVYTAHEIAQIIPLVDKEKVFEKFWWLNRWIEKYWPNAIGKKNIGNRISNIGKSKTQYSMFNILFSLLEPFARGLQYLYMRKKITRETVSKKKALFHPQDWGEVVEKRFFV